MADEIRTSGASDDDIRQQAEQYTLAANPLVGVRVEDIMESARVLFSELMS